MANNPVIVKLKVATDDYREQTGLTEADLVIAANALFILDEDTGSYRELTNYDLAWPTADSVVGIGTLAVTTSAAQASTGLGCKSVMFRADSDNTVDVLMGDVTTQSFPLQPGESITVSISNVSPFYFKTASGTADLHWMAVN